MPDDGDNNIPCLCKVCDNDLVAKKNVALLCDSCNSWFCYTCMGVAKKIFDVLNHKNTDTSMIKVSCKECMKTACHVNLSNSLEVMKKGISDQLKNLSGQIDALKTESMTKVEESIQLIKVQNTEAKSSWANVVSMGLESSQSIKAVQEAVKISGKEHIECEEREKSILLFHVPESKSENSIQQKKDDLIFAEKFIGEGLNLTAQPIQSHFRIGRFEQGKTRPIKVIFCHKSGQVKVIENLSALRNAHDDYNKVSVCIDRNVEQRNIVKELVKKAKEQTDNSNTKKYVVRGHFRPYIHELNKS